MTIREFTVQDIPYVYALGAQLLVGPLWKRWKLDPGHQSAVCLTFINHPDKQGWVLCDKGKQVGVLLVELQQHQFVPGLTFVYEVVFFVEPPYRESRYTRQLWKKAIEWGKQHGASATFRGYQHGRKETYTWYSWKEH